MIIGRARLKTIVAGQFGLNWYAIDRRCVRRGQGEIAGQAVAFRRKGFGARHSRESGRESGNPGQPLCRCPWTPAFAGVTGWDASIKSDDAPSCLPSREV